MRIEIPNRQTFFIVAATVALICLGVVFASYDSTKGSHVILWSNRIEPKTGDSVTMNSNVEVTGNLKVDGQISGGGSVTCETPGLSVLIYQTCGLAPCSNYRSIDPSLCKWCQPGVQIAKTDGKIAPGPGNGYKVILTCEHNQLKLVTECIRTCGCDADCAMATSTASQSAGGGDGAGT
jgi:hypothetical protein